ISPAELAAIIDARVAVLADRKEALAALPTFVREASAKTASAGLALSELIPRIAHGQDGASRILVEVIKALGEDSRAAAAGIIMGCLRAGDADVATAAANAVDKELVTFREAAQFPDLVTPALPPKRTLDSGESSAMLAAAAFRGSPSGV